MIPDDDKAVGIFRHTSTPDAPATPVVPAVSSEEYSGEGPASKTAHGERRNHTFEMARKRLYPLGAGVSS